MTARVCLFVVALLLSGCNEESAYTLYRNSPGSSLGESARLHIATFDAYAGEDYNRQNCLIAADLFKYQPGVTVRYWCEKGRYKS